MRFLVLALALLSLAAATTVASATPWLMSIVPFKTTTQPGIKIVTITLGTDNTGSFISGGVAQTVGAIGVFMQDGSAFDGTLALSNSNLGTTCSGAPCNGFSISGASVVTNGSVPTCTSPTPYSFYITGVPGIGEVGSNVSQQATVTCNSGIAITDHNVAACGISGQPITSCTGPTLTVATGEFLIVESTVCSPNCDTGPPSVTGVTTAGTATMGSCVEFALAGTFSQPNLASDAYLCPVTAGGSVTPTVDYSIVGYYGFAYAQAVSGAVGDDGIGNGIVTVGATQSVQTNGSTTRTSGSGDLCVSLFASPGANITVTPGETILDSTPYPGNGNGITQYQYAGPTPTAVTATATFSQTVYPDVFIVCLK